MYREMSIDHLAINLKIIGCYGIAKSEHWAHALLKDGIYYFVIMKWNRMYGNLEQL